MERPKEKSGRVLCIICNKTCTEKQKNPLDDTWKTFEEVAKAWKDVDDDEYGAVYEKVNWENGAIGVFWHKNCKFSFVNKRSLEQATVKYENKKKKLELAKIEAAAVKVKRRRKKKWNLPPRDTRKNIGVISKKESCLWCERGKAYSSHFNSDLI